MTSVPSQLLAASAPASFPAPAPPHTTIHLAPSQPMLGRALSQVIKAKALLGSVMVYYNELDFLLLRQLVDKVLHLSFSLRTQCGCYRSI